jgi:hypothetical protein
MTPRSLFAALLALVAAAAGCEGQPTLLCDRSRVVWPFFEIDTADDISDQEGIQIDIDLRTSYLPGSVARLTIEPEEGDPIAHPLSAVVADDGALRFEDVTVPLGRIGLSLAIVNECGEGSSRRELYVWDGLGYPECTLTLSVEPDADTALAPLGVLREEHDGDPGRAGVQLSVQVATGRPDMQVFLFLLDLESGEEEKLEQESGDDRVADYDLTLPEGQHAMRAVCHWTPAGLSPSSVTRNLFVDTRPPACTLVEPTSRVMPADDLDDVEPGVQFLMVGRSPADDVAGQPVTFSADGTTWDTELDQTGRAEVIATIDFQPGQPQELSVVTSDLAGNRCADTETF